MLCIKCQSEIPEGSKFCNICGKKQVVQSRARTHKRARGTGTIRYDKRNKKNPWCAYAPATTSGSGRIYLNSYPTRLEAQQAIDEYIKNGRPDLYNATVEDVYNLWSESHYTKISENTVISYKTCWKHFAIIKNIKMSELRTSHLQRVVDEANGAFDIIKVLGNQLCKFAMQNDILNKNYSSFIKKPKKEKREKVIFTNEQIALLWAHKEDTRIQTILVMIYTGFRIGEVIALTVENVHLDDGYIIGGEKTDAGKNRIVPFPSAIPEIKEFVSNWVDNAAPDGKLFPYSIQTFRNKAFYTPLIEAGIIKGSISDTGKISISETPHVTPHSTRHTFATKAVQAGINPKELQKLIGHERIQTTLDVYAHTNTDALKAEMSKLTKAENCA